MSIIVAVAQFEAGQDKAANLKKASELVDEAADRGAEFVVLPEYSMYCDLGARSSLYDVAETLDGSFVSGLGERARAHSVTLLAGLTERDESTGHAYNTLVLIGPSGDLHASYRKIHLFDAFGYRESDTVAAGEPSAQLMFDLGGVRFGAMTCYDLRFPELARSLIDKGVTALVVPAAWAFGPGKEHQWRTLATARAIENTSYVVAAGQTAPTGSGQSMVIDPMGTAVAAAGELEGVAVATLDPARVDTVRAKVPSLANRRFTVHPT